MEKVSDHNHSKSPEVVHSSNNSIKSKVDRDTQTPETKNNEILDNDLSKPIFDHLRNYLMCSFLLAIGIAEVKQQSGLFFDLVSSVYAGVAIIALSCALFSLNLYDGIRKISQYKYRSMYTIGLIVAYMVMSIGVIEIAVSFRASL